MPSLRRPPSPDPAVHRRLAVLLPAPVGWVPGGPGPAGPRVGGHGADEVGGHGEDSGEDSGGGSGDAWGTGLPGEEAVRDRWVRDGPSDASAVAPDGPSAVPAAPGAATRPGDARHGAGGGTGVLDAWRAARVDPGRRGLVVLALVGLLAAALSAGVVLRGRPSPVPAPDVVRSGAPVPGSAGGASPGPGGEVVVSVGGRVAHPGLLRLPAGSRVDDAVRAAGGAAPDADLTGLNLARRLVDGEQVLVGVPPGTGVAAPGGAGGAGARGLVDLNTATTADLDALPGVGPVLAQRIVDWRTEHGRFGSVDQLREVEGIGESKYAQIKAKVAV